MVESGPLMAWACAAALAGFAWLALAMPTHWQHVHGGRPLVQGRRRRLRVAAAAALATSLGLCLAAQAAAMAVLVWLLLLPAAALSVALLLHLCPGALRRVWPS